MPVTIDGTTGYYQRPTPPPVDTNNGSTTAPTTPVGRYRPEPSYHPQAPAPLPPTQTNPYALPAGQTLSGIASGTQAQPFDVTLSQLATAVYAPTDFSPDTTFRGDPPEGWNIVSDSDLQARGITDPTAWRQQFLGGGEQTMAQEYRAEVFTDGNGNYVLSYRGTAEGGADWNNNFTQGTGFTTDGAQDKFSGTAVNTAIEFERVFGNQDQANGESSNLAITGHSQGGGLATVGSIASGVPAVTFDASGIHPNTWDRMGIDPQRARDLAENGQIRAYSLQSDLLTQAQESGPLGLMTPDALGTKIVVAPAEADEHNMFNNYGPTELAGKSPEELARINALVEAGKHTPFLPIGLLPGLLTGGANLAGNVAYSAISHSPNALTNAMIDRQPWQDGYENPSDSGKWLQELVPDTLKDDYARNTHDLVSDIVDVVNTDFARGDFVQGGFSIFGDVVEGFYNSAGDTLDTAIDGVGNLANRGIDALGNLANGGIDLVGGLTEGTFNLAGDLGNGGLDLLGDGTRTLAGFGGDVVRGLGDQVGLPGVGDSIGDVIDGGGAAIDRGLDAMGRGFEAGADAVGDVANTVIDTIGDGVDAGVDALGDAADATIDVIGDGVEWTADAVGTVSEAAWDGAGKVAQGVTDGAKAVGDFLNPFN